MCLGQIVGEINLTLKTKEGKCHLKAQMNYDQTERLAKIYRKPKQVTPSFLCLYLVYL